MAIRSIFRRSRSIFRPIARTLQCHFSYSPTPNPHNFSSSALPRPRRHSTPFFFCSQPLSPGSSSRSSSSSSPELVNDICRVLSDFRNPRDDIVSALSHFSSNITTELVEQVLKRCKNLGFAAHRFFLWAKQLPGFVHSRDSYHILIDILGSSRQFPLLWDFLGEIKESQSCEIRSEIFWLIFRAYAKANLPSDAIRAFNNMVDFGIKPSTTDLDQLLFVLCKRKHVSDAQQFFDKVKNEFSPTVKTYSILVRGWGSIGQPSEAQKVFDEMLHKGCSVDVLAYNSVLEYLCKGGKMDEASKMFNEMRPKGLEPDAFTYSIFIHAACEANDIHSAFRVLDRMKRHDLMPNVFTYNCIIHRLCKNGNIEEAYQLLEEMIERGAKPDVWSYNAILAFHCNRGEVNMASNLVSRMEKDSCEPDRHTYNMYLKLLIRMGRFDRLTSVWDGMGKRGFHPSASTYAVMVHGLCGKKGKLEEACRYFEMMIDDGIPPYPSTCEWVRSKIVSSNSQEKLEILVGKMERSTSCRIRELSAIIRGIEEGKMERMKELFVIMRGNGENVRSRREVDSSDEGDY